MKLSQHTVLQRAPGLKLRVESNNMVQVATPAGELESGPHTLAVLDAFAEPRALGAALAQLGGPIAGFQDWIDLTNTLAQLFEAGVLRGLTGAPPPIAADEVSEYYAAPAQVELLNNRARVAGLLRAIGEVVKPGDLVVNLHAGTGVFAIAAARAGARHVYATETGHMADLARAMIAGSGLAERITLLAELPSQIKLPEPATVLIDAWLAADPLGEYSRSVLDDARARYLAPAATLVPARAEVYGLPLSIPPAELNKHTFTASTVANWREWYGIDFGPFVGVANQVNHVFTARAATVRAWPALSAPVLLAEVDLQAQADWAIDTAAGAVATADGLLNGVLLYHAIQCGTAEVAEYSSQAAPGSDPTYSIWVLAQQPELRAGDAFTMAYRRHVPGAAGRISAAVAGQPLLGRGKGDNDERTR